jgi:hypothetical protein
VLQPSGTRSATSERGGGQSRRAWRLASMGVNHARSQEGNASVFLGDPCGLLTSPAAIAEDVWYPEAVDVWSPPFNAGAL